MNKMKKFYDSNIHIKTNYTTATPFLLQKLHLQSINDTIVELHRCFGASAPLSSASCEAATQWRAFSLIIFRPGNGCELLATSLEKCRHCLAFCGWCVWGYFT